MGILLQAVQNKLNELKKIQTAPAPAFKADPHKIMADLKERAKAEYLEDEVGTLLIGYLRKLPKEKQDEFYDRCIQEDRKGRFTKNVYENRLDPNSLEGKTKKTWLISNGAFGQDWQKTVETLEEMIGPEEAEKAAAEIPSVKAPDDPSIKREEKLEFPYAGELNALKNALPPEAAADRQLLDEVNADLAVVPNSMLSYLDVVDGEKLGAPGFQTTVNGIHYDEQNDFIDNIQGGRFKKKLPSIPSKNAKAGYFYGTSMVSQHDSGLSDKDLEDIRQLKPDIPQELKDDLISMTGRMDKLGEENYRVPGKTCEPVSGGEEGEQRFRSEQGTKYYAYWPLDKARKALVQAVREKDMDKIREAHEAYRNTRNEMDEMLRTVQKHPTGICSGNINSTRPDEEENPVPLEHLEDFAGHSQVNGVFCLYALSKNLKVPVKDILDDPAAVLSSGVKTHIKEHGLNAQKTTGGKLLMGLSSGAANRKCGEQWSDNGMLCNRAFENIASLADDPKDRPRILGTVTLATGAASCELMEYIEKWQSLSALGEEKTDVLYQHALLLPEGEFDPIAMADEFAKPDWKERLDPGKLIDRLKQEGKLDVRKLAERVETIAQEAADADDPWTKSNYSEDALRFSAFNIYKSIAERSTSEERENIDLKMALAESTKHAIGTESFNTAEEELFSQFDVQKFRKSGWFLSSADTQEHQRMVQAQDALRYKLMQLQGKELPPLPQDMTRHLDSISLQDACAAAREATFDYCAKKTDNGRSFRFLHEAGENRFEAAWRSIKIIDTIADGLGLRTPAQKAMDSERFDILDKRGEEKWSKDEVEKKAARLIYAMTLDKQPQLFEGQQKRLDPARVEQGIAYIRGQDAFKEMFRKEGAGKITDYMISGHGQLTDAYIRGMKSVDEKQHGGKDLKDPKTMTSDEKDKVLKETPLQM
ncbi:MAG: hypothetical protein K5707_02340 [Clostridia bacterium]|nr:hypothetical protein [Clostridia bacterium]